MTIFELVKIALDELYTQGKSQHGNKLDGVIKEKLAYLSKNYKQLNNRKRQPVDYRDPATRFAYVYKYVSAHGDYVVQVMQQLRGRLNKNIFKGPTARVSCIGGGPGSDIIAILKYLDEQQLQETVKKLTCYLLDKEQAWADTWTEIDDLLNVDVQLNVNFQPLDVTEPKSWEFQQKFLEADLFTMSYFLSEVYCLDGNGAVTKFWQELFAKAKSGSFFVYDDNGHEDFNHYFDAQWNRAGLECIIKKDNVAWTPRFEERASELRVYMDKFAGEQPKLKGYLSYRVLRKP